MVVFRGGDSALRALEALGRARDRAAPAVALQAVVVDNASGDGTCERVRRAAPWAEVLELPRNRGFAAGSNAAIARLDGADVVVLLNPDVDVRDDFLERLAALDWPRRLAARGPAVFDERGGIEQSARGFPRVRTGVLGRTSLLARLRPGSRMLRPELRADAGGGARPVDWVSGACLIAPATRLAEVGPLDEGYFMYWEDADWCFRARELGLEVQYEPSLVVTHRQGTSSRERPFATTVAFHRSALRYWRLHVARSRVSVAAAGVALGLRCLMRLAGLALRRAVRRMTARRSGSPR
jgi:GT2 family glycosyltransferase